MNVWELSQKLLFPHPPTQHFNPTVIPQIELNSMRLQEEKRESREHSQKSPQIQVREGQTSRLRQPPHQRSCQDVRMDPHYQKPPHYSQIQHHRSVPQPAIEVNEIGPTIQQGVIQCPVQRGTQSTDVRQMNAAPLVDTRQTVARVPSSNTTDASVVLDPVEDGRNRQPEQERDPNHNGYVLNCVHKNRPLTLNDVARPVFVNHYYAGELFIPTTSKKLIKLDECDASTDNSIRNIQLQGTECECREYSRNSPARQQQARIENRNSQPKENNSDMHSKFPEQSRNSLRTAAASQKGVPMQGERNINRGIHSKFTEHSQHSLGALNIGKSRVQATDQINSHQIPLTGYENFVKSYKRYPVSRDPMTVQLTGLDNISSSALLDLPNINTNLPPPLVLNPSPHHQINQMEITNPGQVTNSEILKSIQSITEVMQQQLLLNSKTTEQGIVQTASLSKK